MKIGIEKKIKIMYEAFELSVMITAGIFSIGMIGGIIVGIIDYVKDKKK